MRKGKLRKEVERGVKGGRGKDRGKKRGRECDEVTMTGFHVIVKLTSGMT